MTKIVKATLGAIAGVGSYLLDCITEILIVLAIFMIIDYIVGITVALLNDTWNKEKGVRGAIKKLGYGIVVFSAFILDFVIIWLSQKAGYKFSTGGFFGIAVTCYLIGTEWISISKNLYILGVPVPPFLTKMFENLKNVSNKK